MQQSEQSGGGCGSPVKDQHCALARAGLEPTAQPELHCKGPQSEVIRAIFVFTLQPESEVIRATMLEGSPHWRAVHRSPVVVGLVDRVGRQPHESPEAHPDRTLNTIY